MFVKESGRADEEVVRRDGCPRGAFQGRARAHHAAHRRDRPGGGTPVAARGREAGARGEMTRAIIKYLIRRRIAGATFRAQRATCSTGWRCSSAQTGRRRTGTRHGLGSAIGRRRIGAMTRSTTRTRASRDAGRGVGGLTRSSFRCLMDLIYRSSSSFSFSLFSRCFSSARSRMPSVLSRCLFCS